MLIDTPPDITLMLPLPHAAYVRYGRRHAAAVCCRHCFHIAPVYDIDAADPYAMMPALSLLILICHACLMNGDTLPRYATLDHARHAATLMPAAD